MKFYTAGYGNKRPEEFFDLLKEAGVSTLIDVREKPSGWSSSYRLTKKSKTGIVGELTKRNIGYVWIHELGNQFRKCEDWRSLYSDYLDSIWDEFYKKLISINSPACLMCGCAKVEVCHRGVITKKLDVLGYEVKHL